MVPVHVRLRRLLAALVLALLCEAAECRRPAVSMMAVVLASCWLRVSASDAVGPQHEAPQGPWVREKPLAGRHLQMAIEDMLHDDYVHTHYTFNLERANMKRQGLGEFWLKFDPQTDLPHIRMKGAAHSPRFGDGEITIVIDPKNQVLHALFALGELHEAECVTYPFPRSGSLNHKNTRRFERMVWRKDQVVEWMKKDDSLVGKADKLLSVHWTKKSVLEFDLVNGGRTVQGVRFRKGGRTTKYVQFQDLPDSAVGGLFEPPAPNCRMQEEVPNSLAHLELTPPHRQSSALNDLLLVLSGHPQTGGKWPRLFLVFSALAVPGDVAVMIEDPVPPNPGKVGAVAFDYTSAVISRGVKHHSEGSIWMNPSERAFRLRGEAKKTKVGPLFMDLIAQAGVKDAKLYANVNLTVQEEQQCVMYPYPVESLNASQELKTISAQGLSFYAIDELNGEDCGIFVAPLARGHWVHIWVDMESDNPDAILRSEMHVAGKVIRSTEIRNWRTNQRIQEELQPAPEWHCSSNPAAGQLAHLGLSNVHSRSLELRDALYAVHTLDGNFAVLEILGLTGDVAIMVQEPEVPQLWKAGGSAFSYTFSLDGESASKEGKVWQAGLFFTELSTGKVRIAAAHQTGAVSIALDPGRLAVMVEESGQKPQCLVLPLDADMSHDQPVALAAIFNGVEAVGNTVCNHFTFLGAGSQAESIDLWYSQEEDAICRLAVRPPVARSGAAVAVTVLDELATLKHSTILGQFSQLSERFLDDPDSFDCQPAVGKSWLQFAASAPSDMLPAAAAISRLSQAAGAVGLLGRTGADALSRLSVTSPVQHPAPIAQQRSIFDPDLEQFAFSYTSHFPLQAAGSAHPGVGQEPESGNAAPGVLRRNRGSGDLRVDLRNRRMYFKGTANNISAGLPEVESRIIFRGDRNRMYVYTRAGEFEQCWVMNSAEAVPAPISGQQMNPFRRAKKAAERVWISGDHGALSDKYSFNLEGLQKRVQLFVNGDSGLAAINVDDLQHGVSVGALVHDWDTGPIEEDLFEPNSDFHCEEPVFDEEPERLAEWDLIRIFFPGDVSDGDQQQRKLFEL